jgi:hypothetical protein
LELWEPSGEDSVRVEPPGGKQNCRQRQVWPEDSVETLELAILKDCTGFVPFKKTLQLRGIVLYFCKVVQKFFITLKEILY